VLFILAVVVAVLLLVSWWIGFVSSSITWNRKK
jgi:hypothetical protein